jgi:drug/metabolite transporter (DMT)-like permease
MSSTLLALLMLLSAIWGASFLFIKIGVAEMGPFTFAMLRTLIGSSVLLIVLRLKREGLPRDGKLWLRFGIMGFFNALIPYATIAWGTQYIPSGLSAILDATMPLFTIILAAIWGGERLTLRRVGGILLGFAGILVLTWPELRGGLRASLWGELAVVIGSLSYAIAAVYARRNLLGQPPMTASLGQVGTGFILLAPFSLTEKPWVFHPSTQAVLSLLALGVLGTALAYILYYRLLQGLGATGASLVTYIVPVFGVFWGWAILGERLGWNAFLALGMILVGVVLTNDLLSLRRPRQQMGTRGGA